MALTWNLDAIKDHKQVCWIDNPENVNPELDSVIMNPVTKALIFATMSVDIGRITEDNAGEFYARLRFFERLWGEFVFDGDGKPHWITPEEVTAHIGMYTNVVTTSRARSGSPRSRTSCEQDADTALYDYKRAMKKVSSPDLD